MPEEASKKESSGKSEKPIEESPKKPDTSALQSEFDNLQKQIDQKTQSLEKREKELDKRERDLDEKEKRSRGLSGRQIIIPVIIYIVMLLSVVMFGANLLLLAAILAIGIIVWGILTFQYNKIQKTNL